MNKIDVVFWNELFEKTFELLFMVDLYRYVWYTLQVKL